MTPTSRTIETFEDLGQLARRAADEFVRRCSDAVAKRGRFTVALSGGSTPRGLYALLAERAEYRDRILWRSSHFFWGDERCVPPDHADSNFGMATSAMFSKVDVPPGNVHRIRGELPGAEAAKDYEEQLRAVFSLAAGEVPRFDLILLGMGADGHTASLFPGTAAVREKTKLVVANWVPKLSAFRITLTPPVLNGAELVTFLVAGPDKAAALEAVLEGPSDPDRFPAQAIQPSHGVLVWLVERAAASRLHL
jgi:6-phosphogluconolactonase